MSNVPTIVIAEACHEANRVLQRAFGDPVSAPWEDESEETKASAVDGIDVVLAGAGPEESHENWVRFKVANGWVWGEEKDERKKTHPLLVPYSELPPEQRVKDYRSLLEGAAEILPGKALR